MIIVHKEGDKFVQTRENTPVKISNRFLKESEFRLTTKETSRGLSKQPW